MNKKLGIFLIVIGIILSSINFYKRIKIEGNNKSVEIITNPQKTYDDSKVCVLEEYTLAEWVEKSWVGKWQPGMLYPFGDYKNKSFILIFDNLDRFKRAKKVLQIKIPDKIQALKVNKKYYLRIIGSPWNELKDIGLGVSNENDYIDKRLYIRLINDKWVNADYINWVFSDIPAGNIIFKGSEVIGYPDYLDIVGLWVKKKNIKLFTVEFSKQKGLKDIAIKSELVRLHSLPASLNDQKKIARAVRAVKERNIRAVYINEPNQNLLNKINNILSEENYTLGDPLGFKITNNKNILSLLGVIFIIMGFTVLFYYKAVFILINFLMLLGIFLIPHLVINILIIYCAVFFPVLATKIATDYKCSFIKALAIYFAFSIFAGFLISSAAGTAAFMVNVNQLRGIKLALIFPVILCAFMLYENISGRIKENVKWEELAFLSIIASIAVVYLLRSSNNQVGLVSNLELKIRSFLENIFIYRPRFKEFLFGHPLLIAGLYFLKKNKHFKYSKILVIAGIVGQVSIINTFMHIHTPVVASVIRTCWGITLGGMLGLLLVFILKKWIVVKV